MVQFWWHVGWKKQGSTSSDVGHFSLARLEPLMVRLRLLSLQAPLHTPLLGLQASFKSTCPHCDHEDHALTVAVHGHCAGLQVCDWVCDLQATPPCSGAVLMLRVRVCVPPPHGCEQSPHPLHVSSSQSIGQKCVLQCFASAFSPQPHNASPPSSALCFTERVRLYIPGAPVAVVQVFEHVVQGFQSFMVQHVGLLNTITNTNA